MGPVEEAGKAASGFIDAMRAQPLALALSICNILLLIILFYVAQTAGRNRAAEFTAVLDMQKEVQKLLYSCTPMKSGLMTLEPFKLESAEERTVELPPVPLPQQRPGEAP